MDRGGLATIAVLIALVAIAIAVLRLVGSSDRDEPVPGQQSLSPTARPSPTAGAGAGPPAPTAGELAVEDLATDLAVPWGVAFAADGTAYVSERDTGRILVLRPDEAPSELTRLAVDPAGEGGLLGLAAHPDGVADGGLYAYLTTDRDNRIVRLRPPATAGDPEPILTGIPAASIHNGGRIAFGPDGLLYAGTGDAASGPRAQDRSSLGGKILRLTPDGGVPGDNPFAGSPVFSLGHRNVQGLAWTADGQLYATEFGPDRDDEVNRIRAGQNYGWPAVTGRADDSRFVDPVHVRQPPEASWSGAVIPRDGPVGPWEGQLLAASLRGERLWRLPLDGARPDSLLVGELGRLRLAAQAPDGAVWLLTSNRDGRGRPRAGDDRIVRLSLSG